VDVDVLQIVLARTTDDQRFTHRAILGAQSDLRTVVRRRHRRHTVPMADHEYTGHVEPGGPAAVRELGSLTLRKLSVGPMDNNSYLLTCRATGAQMLIDAAADPEALRALIQDGSPEGRLDVLLTTHSHHDHVGALAEIAEATGAVTVAGAEDVEAIPARIDRPLAHGDVLEIGEE